MKKNDAHGSLWLLASSTGLGGAERRTVKIATQMARDKVFANINLLVNRQLAQEYLKDGELAEELSKGTVRMMTKEGGLEQYLFSDVDRINLIKRVHPCIRDFRGAYAGMLKRLSWMTRLAAVTTEKDMLHCIYGDPARNGALFLAAQRPSRVLLEVTNNRLIGRLAAQLSAIIPGASPRSRVFIRCVSKTVYQNLTRILPEPFYRNHHIDLGYFSDAFMDATGSDEDLTKEKVIIFPHRFIGPKNPIMFCRVIRRLLDQGQLSGWKIKIRGRGILENEMRRMLAPYIKTGVVKIGFSYQLDRELSRSMLFVSIIVTGSTTSTSLFEAMRNGNLLLLSRSGENDSVFTHPDICWVSLSEAALADGLLRATAICESRDFQAKSRSMRACFETMRTRAGYLKDLLRIYKRTS